MGGLGNADYFREAPPSPDTMSPTKRSRKEGPASVGKTSRAQGGYQRAETRPCFAHASGGCEDPNCRYVHSEVPAQDGRRRKPTSSGARGGSAGGARGNQGRTTGGTGSGGGSGGGSAAGGNSDRPKASSFFRSGKSGKSK